MDGECGGCGCGMGMYACGGCCLDSGSGVFWLFLVAKEMVSSHFLLVKGMGASVLATRGHCPSSFTCPDSGNCPFIPERILEVSLGKHLKEKAVFTFRKHKVDNCFSVTVRQKMR